MNPENTTATGPKPEIKKTAKEVAANASEGLKTSAQDVADSVSSEAASYAQQAKDTAADEVKSVASALRSAAADLRSGSPQERTFGQIADVLADASEAMRDKDLGGIVGDLNSFAKRNPLVFLGGAALVGFAATRFAKASADDGHQNEGASPPRVHGAMERPAGRTGAVAGATTGSAPGLVSASEGETV